MEKRELLTLTALVEKRCFSEKNPHIFFSRKHRWYLLRRDVIIYVRAFSWPESTRCGDEHARQEKPTEVAPHSGPRFVPQVSDGDSGERRREPDGGRDMCGERSSCWRAVSRIILVDYGVL